MNKVERQVVEIMNNSQVVPTLEERKVLNPKAPERAKVNPERFLKSMETLKIGYRNVEAINYMRMLTRVESNEYTMLFSARHDSEFVLATRDWYSMEFKKHIPNGSAEFSREMITSANKIRGEERLVPIYCHTHVESEWFSVRDLAFLVGRAIRTVSDVYGLLITPKGVNAVKFDRKTKEFYHLEVQLEAPNSELDRSLDNK